MLELLSAPDQVVAMRVTGRVDEADIERGIQAIEAALARRETVSLLAEVDMSGMTAGAFAKDLSYSLGRLRDLHRSPRVAVVTSQEWLRTLAEVQNRFLPRVEVRALHARQRGVQHLAHQRVHEAVLQAVRFGFHHAQRSRSLQACQRRFGRHAARAAQHG